MGELICTNKACERVGKVQGKSQEPQFWECSCCWTGYNLDLKPEPPPDEAAESLAALRNAPDFAAFRDAYCCRKEAEHAKAEGIPVEQIQARVELAAVKLAVKLKD